MKTSPSITRRLVSGSGFAALGKGILAISALALNALVTRLLPPDEVGAYFLLSSIAFMGALIAQLGVHQAIIRAVAGSNGGVGSKGTRSAIKAAFLIVSAGLLLVCIPYVLGAGRWLGNEVLSSELVSSAVVLAVAWIVLRAYQTLVSQTFRGLHKIGYATIFEGTSTSIIVVLLLAYLWLTKGQAGFTDVVHATLIALSISVVLGLFLLRKPYTVAEKSSGIDVWSLLRISLPLFVATTAMQGIAELHIWILGSAADEEAVAVYGAAFRVARFVVLPLLIINSVIPPMIAQLVAQRRTDSAERVLRATATVAGIPTMLVVLVLVFFAGNILSVIFGDYYQQGAGVLLILVFAHAINTITGSPGVLLMMSDRQGVVMRFALFSGMFGFLVSVVLVQRMGYNGVALGAATGIVANNLGMWLYCKRRLGISTHMSIRSLSKNIFSI